MIDKYVIKKNKVYTKGTELPRLIAMKNSNYKLNKKEVNLEKDLSENRKKFKQIISASKNVFGVTVSLIQLLSDFKEAQKP